MEMKEKGKERRKKDREDEHIRGKKEREEKEDGKGQKNI